VCLLFDKVISSPSTEEGRTCAVLAVRIIKEHGFSVVDPVQPAKSSSLLADAFRDMVRTSSGVNSEDWPTGVRCVYCRAVIMRSQKYTYFDGAGAVHNSCLGAYAASIAASSMKKDSG
jgi:hypothetical protein